MSKSPTLVYVDPEVVAKWQQIGSLSYVWRSSYVRELRNNLLMLVLFGSVMFVSGNYFHLWEPNAANPWTSVPILIVCLSLLVAVTTFRVRKQMEMDRRQLLISSGLGELDPATVGLTSDKPNVLYS